MTTSAHAALAPCAADGLARLLAFHRRIRRALRDLEVLARASSRDDGWRRRAGALLHLLRGPFVWHDLDEELLLAPLLLARSWPAEVERMIEAMSAVHEGMEARTEPLAQVLARAAGGLDVDGAELRGHVGRFVAHVEASLAAEELLFARVAPGLSVDEKRALADQMTACDRARRAAAR